MLSRVGLLIAECAIKSRSSDFTNEIDGCELRKCFDDDLVDRDPRLMRLN